MIWYIFGIIAITLIVVVTLDRIYGYNNDKVDLTRKPTRRLENICEITHSFKSFEDYVDSYALKFIKIIDLPKTFKIGSVYFNKQYCEVYYYFASDRFDVYSGKNSLKFIIEYKILSHIEIDGKIYDNGVIDCKLLESDSDYINQNSDLERYVLNNLDRVEEVK